MKEATLRQFFEGRVSARELAVESAGSVKRHTDGAGVQFAAHYITNMPDEFTVTPDHLVRLVDAVLEGELSLDALDAAVFCLEASDRFVWDADEVPADRIPDALFWLGTPEINYPLTEGVIRKIRDYLLTGEKTLTRADSHGSKRVRETRQAKIREGGV